MHGGTGGPMGVERHPKEDKNYPGRMGYDWSKRGRPVHARHMRSRCFAIPRGKFGFNTCLQVSGRD